MIEFFIDILLNLTFSPYFRSKLRGSPFNPSDPISLRLFPALFYFSFAIAGLTGGLVHQFFPHTNAFSDTPLGWELLWRITVIMTGFAGSALILTGLNLVATEYSGMEKLGKHRWSLRLYGGVIAVLIAGVNTIWGGIAADWASYYFTAFNFLVGPIFIAITGLFAQFFWQRLSLPSDRTTFFLYSATGAVFALGAIVQVYFSGICSFPNARELYGCPLPDFFNHNVIMHLIQSVACVMLLYVTGRHLRKFQEYTITWSQSKNHLKGG